jgi:hypothetical protein
MNRAIRVYRLNLYGRTRSRAVPKVTSQYVLAAADDDAALEAAVTLHARIISRAPSAELTNDQDARIAVWSGGVAQDAQAPASPRAEGRSPIQADIQWGGSKASHWAQTLSFMFRMVRVASISGR